MKSKTLLGALLLFIIFSHSARGQNECDQFISLLSAVGDNFKGLYNENGKKTLDEKTYYPSSTKLFQSENTLVIHDNLELTWTMQLFYGETKNDDKFFELYEQVAKCIYKNNLNWKSNNDKLGDVGYEASLWENDYQYILLFNKPVDDHYETYLLMWYEPLF
jgi:hypothetical protein